MLTKSVSKLNRTVRQFALGGVLALASVASQATVITGNWVGNWSGSGITANFDMIVGPETGLGQFTGNFNWLCTSGINCSGVENFSGFEFANTVAFVTTGFVNPVNLGASAYAGAIAADGLSMTGVDTSAGTWSAHKVVAVPEPATLALMAITLGGMWLASRKRSLFGAN